MFAEAEEGHNKKLQASPLDSFVLSLREARGSPVDDAIETSSLLGLLTPSLHRAHAISDGVARSVMVGDDLLTHGRRLVGILRRQGVRLIESSMEVPHVCCVEAQTLGLCRSARA